MNEWSTNECYGHIDQEHGFHYHARVRILSDGSDGRKIGNGNHFLGCYYGKRAVQEFDVVAGQGNPGSGTGSGAGSGMGSAPPWRRADARSGPFSLFLASLVSMLPSWVLAAAVHVRTSSSTVANLTRRTPLPEGTLVPYTCPVTTQVPAHTIQPGAVVGSFTLEACRASSTTSHSYAPIDLGCDMDCPAGMTQGKGHLCAACPPNTSKASIGNASCLPCPPHTGSRKGSAVCVCVPGMERSPVTQGCTRCPAGKFKPSLGDDACSACPVGTHSSAVGATAVETCRECKAGTYSSAVAAVSNSTCVKCGVGKFSRIRAAAAETACLLCRAGAFVAIQGATACQLCSAGMFSTVTGSSSESTCTACGAGTYSPVAGAGTTSACVQCRPGQFSQATGATVCQLCAQGFLAPPIASADSGSWATRPFFFCCFRSRTAGNQRAPLQSLFPPPRRISECAWL